MTSILESQEVSIVDISWNLPTISNTMSTRHRNHRQHALKLTRTLGIIRARDFRAAGIPLSYLSRLVEAGDLIRLARGLYQEPERVGEHAEHDLAEATRLVPSGIICLISALRHHELTTQLPHAVWMTIPHKHRTPKTQSIRLEIVRATGDALSEGIERIMIEGVSVPIYGVAKTIADCFKYRRHVGEDVAVEALRDALRYRKASVGDLMRFAAIDRVAARIEPYIRAMQ